MKKAKGLGGCFNKTSDYAALNRTATDIKVVHGIIIGQGPIEGVEHGHAWLQKGNLVIDLENGIEMDSDAFEQVARLKYKVTYTLQEAVDLMYEFDHKGPWDKKITKANKAAFKKLNLKYKE